MQLVSPFSQFRAYVLKQLLVQLISGHANAVAVINYIWTHEGAHLEHLHSVIVSCMIDFYVNADDPTRLTRILEVSHEHLLEVLNVGLQVERPRSMKEDVLQQVLKPSGLGASVNAQQHTFAIDLACLAARRDFLKLDKFLDDKLNEIGVGGKGDGCCKR